VGCGTASPALVRRKKCHSDTLSDLYRHIVTPPRLAVAGENPFERAELPAGPPPPRSRGKIAVKCWQPMVAIGVTVSAALGSEPPSFQGGVATNPREGRIVAGNRGVKERGNGL
jgi:hypothetical protein